MRCAARAGSHPGGSGAAGPRLPAGLLGAPGPSHLPGPPPGLARRPPQAPLSVPREGDSGSPLGCTAQSVTLSAASPAGGPPLPRPPARSARRRPPASLPLSPEAAPSFFSPPRSPLLSPSPAPISLGPPTTAPPASPPPPPPSVFPAALLFVSTHLSPAAPGPVPSQPRPPAPSAPLPVPVPAGAAPLPVSLHTLFFAGGPAAPFLLPSHRLSRSPLEGWAGGDPRVPGPPRAACPACRSPRLTRHCIISGPPEWPLGSCPRGGQGSRLPVSTRLHAGLRAPCPFCVCLQAGRGVRPEAPLNRSLHRARSQDGLPSLRVTLCFNPTPPPDSSLGPGVPGQ